MKSTHSAIGRVPLPAMDRPYVIRYGLWGPQIYIGIPAVIAFAAISFVADMPRWLFYAWNGFLAAVAYLCVVQKEVRIHPLRDVTVTRKLLALVPVWRKTYPMTDFTMVRRDEGTVRFTGEADMTVITVSLERRDSADVLALQSWSAGAFPDPGPDQFVSDVVHVTGLAAR